MEINLNLNQIVKVKLTAVGLHKFEDIRKMYGLHNCLPELDDQGYYRIQLWQFMRNYGDLFGNGRDPPVEMDIIIE